MRPAAVLLALALALPAAAQPWDRRDILSFGQRDPQGGRAPEDPPLVGQDGALYGTTRTGGTFGKGVVYRFDPAGSSYRVIHHFVGTGAAGFAYGPSFLQAEDGRFYGLAVTPRLVLYSLASDGSDYRTHFTFPAGAEQGGVFATYNSLAEGPDGLLYGIYVTGGTNAPPSTGNLFRIARDGSGFQSLGSVSDPTSRLSFGAAGQLFGTTGSTVYRLERDGSGFIAIHTFAPPPPSTSAGVDGGVWRAKSNGFLYGWTNRGGASNFGSFFRLREDGSDFAVIFSPSIVTEGGHLRGPNYESSDGFLYGSVGEDGFGTQSFVWRIRPDGTGWQVLKRLDFNGRGTNAVVEAPDGFIYSFTTGGPTNTLFRLARDGSTFATVWNFATADGFPLTPIALVRGADQRFYGLTDANGTGGRGTLFRVSPDGQNYTVLRDFGTGPAAEQGLAPKALCLGPGGAIYGVVKQLGSAGAGVFRYAPADGSFAWMASFAAGITADSANILAGVDGQLYLALDSIASKTNRIFRLAPDGSGFAALRTQTGTASVVGSAALTEGPDGLLYGVTTRNGASTIPLIFRIAKDGSGFLALGEANAGASPGSTPPQALLAAANGRLYGFVTNNFFKMEADGSGFQVLRSYSGNTFARRPLEGFDGRIYGVLPFGGSAGRGCLFRIQSDGGGYEEFAFFPGEALLGTGALGSFLTGPDGAFYGLTVAGGYANRGTIFRVATPAQEVGIAPGTAGFDRNGQFAGLVSGPPGRPVDVWQSDDLWNWSLLQRVMAPEIDPRWRDLGTLPGRRFYRATAP